MAKLSLWLLTLAKDKPFTFLDHTIRCGDSLLGEPYPASSFIATNDAVPNRDSPMFAGSKVRVPHEHV